jgi:hypothetical protein
MLNKLHGNRNNTLVWKKFEKIVKGWSLFFFFLCFFPQGLPCLPFL